MVVEYSWVFLAPLPSHPHDKLLAQLAQRHLGQINVHLLHLALDRVHVEEQLDLTGKVVVWW